MKKRILAMMMAVSVCFTSVGTDAPLHAAGAEIAAEDTEGAEQTESAEAAEENGDAGSTEPTEKPEGTEGTEPAEDTAVTENTEGNEDTEAAEGTESAGNTEGTEPTENTEGSETEETESTENTEETEGSETESTEPTENTEETEGSETESIEPTENTEETEETENTETEDTEETESTESEETEETESTETEETEETEDTEEEEIQEVLLNYIMVESDYLQTPATQNIVASVGEEGMELEDLVLNYKNTVTGTMHHEKVSAQYEDLALFSMEFADASWAGAYELVSISCTLEDEAYELLLSDMDLTARFGVNTDVDANPDDVFYEDEDLSDVDANVVTMDENGAVVSEKTVEDVLDNGIGSGMRRFSDMRGANGNLVVMLDPGHDATHMGAHYNGASEESLVLKIAAYCKAELETYKGVTVYMTRTGEGCPNGGTAGDCNLRRTEYAASVGANVYVSFHLNASTNSGAGGVGVYYPNSNYNPAAGQTGHDLAAKVYEKLRALGLSSWASGIMIWNATYDKYDDGSVADYLGVIRNCKKKGIPAILIEHAFISGTNDYNNFLNSDEKLKALGVADATAIAEYYGLSKANAKPSILYTQAQKGGKLKIVWTKADGAKSYEVWRSTTNNYDYTMLDEVKDATSYVDEDVKAGKKYYYIVRAVYKDGGVSEYSAAVDGRALDKPAITSIVSKSSKKLTITWKKVSGAAGYYIFRKNGDSYDKIATITSGSTVSYADSVPKNNTSYSYKVQAYNTKNGKTGVGSYSSTKSGKAIGKTTITSVLSKDDNTLTITWKKVSGASGYTIQRSTSKDSGYKKIATIKKGSTVTYEDDTVKKDKTYYYRIQTINEGNGGKGYSGYCSPLSGKTLVKTKITSVVSKNSKTLTVKWKKISGASGYTVQRSTSKSGGFKTVATIKKGSTVSYNDADVKAGKTYYYRVRAYKSTDGKKGYSSYSTAVSGKAAPKTSINYVISSGSSALKIGWKEIDGAWGYRIRRSTSESGSYETIDVVTGAGKTSYTDKKLKAGKTYYYKIEVINKVHGTKGYSGNSKAVSGTVLKATTITKAQENSGTAMTITWKKIAGADGYQIYRSTSKNGTYDKVGVVKGMSTAKYKDETLAAGKTYYYKVRAYQKSGTKTGTATFSAPQKVWTVKKTDIAKVSGTSGNKITLNWNKVSKATGYNIYRSTKAGSGFEKIAVISSGDTVKYTDKSVKTGKMYYYKIAATSNITGSTVGRGDYSKTVGVPVLKAAEGLSASIAEGNSAVIRWQAVSNAHGYHVYYGTKKDGEYKKLASVTGTSYTHGGLGTGGNYYYKVRAYYKLDNGSTVYGDWSAVKNLTAGYAIMGPSALTVDKMVSYYNARYHYPSHVYGSKGAADVKSFFTILKEEAENEGVKTEVLFAQVILETGGLQFGGDVRAEQCNFGGMGATGGGVGGATFGSVREGLRAQTQHLKAYASTAPLNNACVDPRFAYVTRGTAPYVEWLSIPNNPYGKGWAMDPNYAAKLFSIMNNL